MKVEVYTPFDQLLRPFFSGPGWIDYNPYLKFTDPFVPGWQNPFSSGQIRKRRRNLSPPEARKPLKHRVQEQVRLRTISCAEQEEAESDEDSVLVEMVKRESMNTNNNGMQKRERERVCVSPSLPNVSRQDDISPSHTLSYSPTEFDLAQTRRITRSMDSPNTRRSDTGKSHQSKRGGLVLTSRQFGGDNGSQPAQSISSNGKSSIIPVYISDSDTEAYHIRPECNASDGDLIKTEYMRNSVCPTPSYPAYDYLKRMLHREERVVDYINGDGNCFFRALSKVLYMTEGCHHEIRQAVVDLIEKYPREFEQFIDGPSMHEYIIEMRRAGTWATQTEIYAAATLLQRDIYILSPDPTGEEYKWLLFSPRLDFSENSSSDPCYLTLCHTNGNHYDRIAALDGGCNCPLSPPVLSGVSGQIDLTV